MTESKVKLILKWGDEWIFKERKSSRPEKDRAVSTNLGNNRGTKSQERQKNIMAEQGLT